MPRPADAFPRLSTKNPAAQEPLGPGQNRVVGNATSPPCIECSCSIPNAYITAEAMKTNKKPSLQSFFLFFNYTLVPTLLLPFTYFSEQETKYQMATRSTSDLRASTASHSPSCPQCLAWCLTLWKAFDKVLVNERCWRTLFPYAEKKSCPLWICSEMVFLAPNNQQMHFTILKLSFRYMDLFQTRFAPPNALHKIVALKVICQKNCWSAGEEIFPGTKFVLGK